MSADGRDGPDSAAGGAPDGASSAHAARLRELRSQLRALADGGATPQELAIHLAASGYDPERAAALLDRLAADEATAEDGTPARGPASAGSPAGGTADGGAPDGGAPDGGAPDGGVPIRVWAPFERARFTPEAWGQLLHLRADGMTDPEFEHLVDRALLQLDGVVGAPELRALLGDAVDPAAPPTVH